MHPHQRHTRGSVLHARRRSVCVCVCLCEAHQWLQGSRGQLRRMHACTHATLSLTTAAKGRQRQAISMSSKAIPEPYTSRHWRYRLCLCTHKRAGTRGVSLLAGFVMTTTMMKVWK
jgi:hypothetical protein